MKCTDLRFRWGRGSQLANLFSPAVLQPRCTPLHALFKTPGLLNVQSQFHHSLIFLMLEVTLNACSI
jgi:hypothetical protein